MKLTLTLGDQVLFSKEISNLQTYEGAMAAYSVYNELSSLVFAQMRECQKQAEADKVRHLSSKGVIILDHSQLSHGLHITKAAPLMVTHLQELVAKFGESKDVYEIYGNGSTQLTTLGNSLMSAMGLAREVQITGGRF